MSRKDVLTLSAMTGTRTPVQNAADDFDMAQYLAEDGAIVNAAILAKRGIETLEWEWKLRCGRNLLDACDISEAVNDEIALQQAVDDFGTAGKLAEDGAIVSAAIVAKRGVEALEREWKRRAPLRVGTPFETRSLSEAVSEEIARRKAARRVS